MNYLSLFSGAGGGDLASQHLLGWRCAGYVEIDEYCQKIIKQRIADGLLDRAPTFGDIRAFLSEGHASAISGLVDVVTAGFPCQPFSVAGKRAGADDPRNMWPAIIEAIRQVRPRFVFLENVPELRCRKVRKLYCFVCNGWSITAWAVGFLESSYFGRILGDLAESGYDARWCCLSAARVGAPHKRERLWIVADAMPCGRDGRQNEQGAPQTERGRLGQDCQTMADADSERELQQEGCEQGQRGRVSNGREDVADASMLLGQAIERNEQDGVLPQDVADAERVAERARLCESEQGGERGRRLGDGGGAQDWWAVEPDVGRVAHGVASRVDRLKSIGNGQVPIVAATAWRLLSGIE